MKLILTVLCLLLSIDSFGQKVFPDDFRKGGIEINSQIENLSLYSMDSLNFNSSDFKNNVTYINYWFVGCRGCRQEEAYLKEISQHFNDRENVQFISITPSSRQKVIEYFQKYGDFGFPVYTVDGFKEAKKLLAVKTFPHNQIIVNGTVIENLQVPIATEEMKNWIVHKIEEELKKLEP